jgi:sugar/nucleoside kinase (ribokinase family)
MDAPQLIVAGTPSTDRIEIHGEAHATVGGSGFITALASRLTGVSVGLVARVPHALPDQIAAVFRPGGIDPSGLIPIDGSLPAFHIAYDGDESATYLEVELGEEPKTRGADIPQRWLTADWIHVGPLGASARVQLRFVEDLIDRGYQGGLSAGTFIGLAISDPGTVRTLFDMVDVAFLNRDEAALIYPTAMPAHTVVCVTAGRSGVRRWDGETWTEHATSAVQAFDPTGAGDAFAGGYLGSMLNGDPDPVSEGLRVASLIIQGPGAAPLLDQLPRQTSIDRDAFQPDTGKAEIDHQRIQTVGSSLRVAAKRSALNFCGSPFPELDDPLALEVLTLATAHQYGFWTGTDHGYGGPMWATIDGVRRKGSDFIWQAFTKAAVADPTVMKPDRLATEPLLFDEICVDDNGACPIPDAGSHRVLQQAYGSTVGHLGGVRSVIDRANSSPDPLATLLESLSAIPGFGEDPLAKKANLLALILANRPEHFLHLDDPSSIAPIADYHNIRTLLRTGCVRVVDEELRLTLEDRAWTDAVSEASVRSAAYEAIMALCDASGLNVGEVDGFLFTLGRSLCLEMEDPKCEECPIMESCARSTALFQPIFRTTAY